MLRSSGFPGTEQVSTEPHQTHPSSSAPSQLPQHNLPGEKSRAYANIPEAKLEDMRKSLETHLEVWSPSNVSYLKLQNQ